MNPHTSAPTVYGYGQLSNAVFLSLLLRPTPWRAAPVMRCGLEFNLGLTLQPHRALAGLSMGGGQSLIIGLRNLDTFAWIGGFSSAPNTKSAAELVPNPADTSRKLKLLWVSCGGQDG